MTENDFDRCVRLFRNDVERAALCILRDPDEAEDIAQEVFLKLYTRHADFESDSHIKAWLLRCTTNLSIDALRSYRKRNSVPLSELKEQPSPSAAENIVLPAIMTLAPKLRIAVYLHYYEGYSIPETAGILKISRSAVKWRLKQGREKLKTLIKGEIEDDL